MALLIFSLNRLCVSGKTSGHLRPRSEGKPHWISLVVATVKVLIPFTLQNHASSTIRTFAQTALQVPLDRLDFQEFQGTKDTQVLLGRMARMATKYVYSIVTAPTIVIVTPLIVKEVLWGASLLCLPLGEEWGPRCSFVFINHSRRGGLRGCDCVISSASSWGSWNYLLCLLPVPRTEADALSVSFTGTTRTSWTSRAPRSWWCEGKLAHYP